MTCLNARLKNIVRGIIEAPLWGRRIARAILAGGVLLFTACVTTSTLYPPGFRESIEPQFGKCVEEVEGYAVTRVWEIEGKRVYVFMAWDGVADDWHVEAYEMIPPVPERAVNAR